MDYLTDVSEKALESAIFWDGSTINKSQTKRKKINKDIGRTLISINNNEQKLFEELNTLEKFQQHLKKTFVIDDNIINMIAVLTLQDLEGPLSIALMGNNCNLHSDIMKCCKSKVISYNNSTKMIEVKIPIISKDLNNETEKDLLRVIYEFDLYNKNMKFKVVTEDNNNLADKSDICDKIKNLKNSFYFVEEQQYNIDYFEAITATKNPEEFGQQLFGDDTLNKLKDEDKKIVEQGFKVLKEKYPNGKIKDDFERVKENQDFQDFLKVWAIILTFGFAALSEKTTLQSTKKTNFNKFQDLVVQNKTNTQICK